MEFLSCMCRGPFPTGPLSAPSEPQGLCRAAFYTFGGKLLSHRVTDGAAAPSLTRALGCDLGWGVGAMSPLGGMLHQAPLQRSLRWGQDMTNLFYPIHLSTHRIEIFMPVCLLQHGRPQTPTSGRAVASFVAVLWLFIVSENARSLDGAHPAMLTAHVAPQLPGIPLPGCTHCPAGLLPTRGQRNPAGPSCSSSSRRPGRGRGTRAWQGCASQAAR